MSGARPWPRGQQARDDFPRFGMTAFAERGPFEDAPVARFERATQAVRAKAGP